LARSFRSAQRKEKKGGRERPDEKARAAEHIRNEAEYAENEARNILENESDQEVFEPGLEPGERDISPPPRDPSSAPFSEQSMKLVKNVVRWSYGRFNFVALFAFF